MASSLNTWHLSLSGRLLLAVAPSPTLPWPVLKRALGTVPLSTKWQISEGLSDLVGLAPHDIQRDFSRLSCQSLIGTRGTRQLGK